MPLNTDQQGLFTKWANDLMARAVGRSPDSDEATILMGLLMESAAARLARFKAWAAQESADSSSKVQDIKDGAARQEAAELTRKTVLDSIAGVTKL